MNFGEFSNDGKAQQPLPPALKDHESELYEFQVYCNNLMLKILTLFAIGLKATLPSLLNLPLTNTSRLIKKPEAETGSPHATVEVLVDAPCVSFTTPVTHHRPTSSPKSISGQAHTATMAP